ncbi:MAG TPA: Mrp/NBP35 family ATP-binding protein [Pirellulales bacterium]|nr:Mrp/NBP35 family ATP-binding protein [Pirellulales bacterium]
MAGSPATAADVLAALKDFQDPETGRGVVDQGQVHDVRIEGDRLGLALDLSTWAAPLWSETRAACVARLREQFPSFTQIEVGGSIHQRPAAQLGELGLRAKSVIAVGSGKGGVGKSTIAASIAYGLRRAGCTVGLMDADVYGPSIPHLVGLNQKAEADENRKIKPAEFDGMKIMSMGFFVPPGEAVVWRGPMLHGAITQFLRDTNWGELDWLVIDMPPGTGDIALTLSQLLPLTGAVVVCTPQDVALLDAVKAIAMFRKVNIPVLGMVENMSYFLCPDNGKRYDIFGHGGAKKRALELDVPFLGEVPITIQVRINGDEGRLAGNFTDPDAAPFFEQICHRLVANLATSHRARPPLPTLSVL